MREILKFYDLKSVESNSFVVKKLTMIFLNTLFAVCIQQCDKCLSASSGDVIRSVQ
jgi:hypothetical protein